MRNIFLLFLVIAILPSCSQRFKEKIGLVTTGPDEYQVQRGQALEIPPHYDLPSPYSPEGNSKGGSGDVDGESNSSSGKEERVALPA